MNDLDDRVRRSLHRLADTVPPSPHARADLERRLARPRRRPLLVAAAAAVVLAAVALPVALTRHASHRVTTPATTPSSPRGAGTEADPFVVASLTDDGVEKAALLWVTEGPGGQLMCTALRPVGEDDPASPPGPDCDPVPASCPTGPHGSGHVRTATVQSDYVLAAGPEQLRELLVFVTAPGVARLEVRAGDGTTVRTTTAFRLPGGVTFAVAEFPGPPWGFGYTAWDARGDVVESAIT